MQITTAVADTVIQQRIGKAMEIGGSTTAAGSGIAGFISHNHEVIWAAGVLIGTAVGVAGLVITVIYKIKEDARQQEMHVEQLRKLREQP